MANLFITCFGLLLLVVLVSLPVASVPLEVGFYRKSCPSAETIVRDTLKKAAASDPAVAAALIRLHFHDCFVRGCDASILLDSKPGKPAAEKESMGNKGVQGFEVIDEAKARIEAQCPNTVSCADIITFAARDSVFTTGGTYYSAPGGRRDGTVSLASEVIKNLPDAFFNATQLKTNFARKGLSLEDMVTLSGAHSIGDSHCSSFSKRLYSFNKTHAQDPEINKAYGEYLKSKCPNVKNGVDPVVAFDPLTPTLLDNNYYKNLVGHKGLLASDQELWSSDLTRKMVKYRRNHPRKWGLEFADAMVKMGSIDVLVGKQGEIRKNCRAVN
ncbi:peroxidase 5-like [Rosa rugosa]|uniref:peroxidase 5-like n=1 Tax=Rosa rugosa TaxID=74645 RepID=UPI002B404ECD|nr:peroxidase 5-like [Rosa rugosa]